jgi:hypothetical protein
MVIPLGVFLSTLMISMILTQNAKLGRYLNIMEKCTSSLLQILLLRIVIGQRESEHIILKIQKIEFLCAKAHLPSHCAIIAKAYLPTINSNGFPYSQIKRKCVKL